MSGAAFGLFFLAVLVGSSLSLFRGISANRTLILAVLRGDLSEDAGMTDEREITVQASRMPILQPVSISICRI